MVPSEEDLASAYLFFKAKQDNITKQQKKIKKIDKKIKKLRKLKRK